MKKMNLKLNFGLTNQNFIKNILIKFNYLIKQNL